MAVVYEDVLLEVRERTLFRQRLCLVGGASLHVDKATVSFAEIAQLPLTLPGFPNRLGKRIDRLSLKVR
jgi:hypothetical protein